MTDIDFIKSMLKAQIEVISGVISLFELTSTGQADLAVQLREIKQIMSDIQQRYNADIQQLLGLVEQQTSVIAGLRTFEEGRDKLLRDALDQAKAAGATQEQLASVEAALNTLRNNSQTIADVMVRNTPVDPNQPAPVDNPTPPAPPTPPVADNGGTTPPAPVDTSGGAGTPDAQTTA